MRRILKIYPRRKARHKLKQNCAISNDQLNFFLKQLLIEKNGAPESETQSRVKMADPLV